MEFSSYESYLEGIEAPSRHQKPELRGGIRNNEVNVLYVVIMMRLGIFMDDEVLEIYDGGDFDYEEEEEGKNLELWEEER